MAVVLADIQGWLPSERKIDNQVGNPTGPTVESWIVDYEAELAELFPAGVPLSVQNALQRELAYQVMVVRATVRNKDVEPLYAEWHKEYEALLEAAREAALAAGAAGVESGEPWSHTMDADQDNPSDPLGPSIRKDQVF